MFAKHCIINVAGFGRASRLELFNAVLFCVIIKIVLWLLVAIILKQCDIFYASAFIYVLLASSLVRRLHDVDRSGWWILVAPTIIGIIPLIAWLLRDGSRYRNRFDVACSKRPLAPRTGPLAIDSIEQLEELRRLGAISREAYKIVRRAALRDDRDVSSD